MTLSSSELPTHTLPRTDTRIGSIGTFSQTGGRLALTPFPPPQPRRKRWIFSFLVMFILPTALGIYYYNFIAARQYVTTAVVSLRVGGEPSDGTSGGGTTQALGSFGPPSSGASLTQSYGVTSYIASMPALDDVITGGTDVRRIFTHDGKDFLTSLPADATPEVLLRRWRSMVTAEFEVTSGVITLTTRAFNAADSLKLSKAVLASTENLLNMVSARMHDDSLSFAESEVASAEARLTGARRELEEFRVTSGVLDVNRSIVMNSQLERRLRQDMISAQREAENLRATIGTGSPMYAAANAKANGIRQQLTEMERQITSTDSGERNGTSNSAIIGRFEALDAQKQLAEKRYTQVMDLLQQARLATMKQGTYILTFVRPVEAVSALYPDRVLAPLTVAGAAFLAWALSMLLYRSLRDHS